jgi:hypothetical protein
LLFELEVLIGLLLQFGVEIVNLPIAPVDRLFESHPQV